MTLEKQDSRGAALILALTALIATLHYSTDIAFHYVHEIYKVLFYIPIILAAFQFGVRGGLAVSLLIALVYTPHVMLDWTDHKYIVINRFVEMSVFVLVGYITGKLVEKERAERDRYERAATELQVSYESLRQKTEALAEVEEHLRTSERMATLGELTASLAHEVRNPLGAMKGAAEILRDEQASNAKTKEFADLLIKDVDRVNEVIENYLGLVKSSPKINGIFDVVEASQKTLQILQSKARKEGKKLETRFEAHKQLIRGDETKFYQIILNLLLNAFAATDKGGKISYNLAQQHNRGEKGLIISIHDDGSGIPEKDLARIFKPFFTTKPEGTGLGLAIAQRYAQEFDWKLTVESRENAGTTARLRIPLKEDEQTKTASG